MVLERLAPFWWAFVLRGVIAILFGVGTLIAPGISLAALVLLYGAYSLADRVLGIILIALGVKLKGFKAAAS